ncbi:unnamed protein product [Urochloa humidicola]
MEIAAFILIPCLMLEENFRFSFVFSKFPVTHSNLILFSNILSFLYVQ